MNARIAPTDADWYRFLAERPPPVEVNFWSPSAHYATDLPAGSPFLFKLKSPHNAICGFAFFVRYARLPPWLAWEAFGERNGCPDFPAMEARIAAYRRKIKRRGKHGEQIGCNLLAQPCFLPEEHWVAQPSDWPARSLRPTSYDLSRGEGARVWNELQARAAALAPGASEHEPRYGAPHLVRPRLGQGNFRIGVLEAYERSCAVTGEHSLPVLEAAHIRPYSREGPHEIQNGLLMRADLHRLFDRGYLTISKEGLVRISPRLREDYDNGKPYYPLDGRALRPPRDPELAPDAARLAWHRKEVYRA